MSKHQKTIDKLKSQPPPSDIKWDELKSLLLSFGYVALKTKKTGGSRRRFFHEKKRALFLCHQPHAPSCVDKGCIVDLVEHLKFHKFL